MASPLLLGCSRTLTDYTFRLRVRAVVAGSEHIGESIIRATWTDLRGVPMAYSGAFQPSVMFGQAVSVRLGADHDYLFALLHGPSDPPQGQHFFSSFSTPALAFSEKGEGSDHPSIEELQALPQKVGEVSLPQKHWPFFVRFEDRSRPETVREVKPEEFDTEYGEGAYIKNVSIEIVRQEPRIDIVQVLPWAGAYLRTLSGRRDPSGELAQRLSSSAFVPFNCLSDEAQRRYHDQIQLRTIKREKQQSQ